MVASMLAFQLARQTARKTTLDHYNPPELAATLTRLAIEHCEPEGRLAWLENFLSVAEFLARETRSPALPGAAPAQQEARQ